jgi:hypothetical protein
MVFSTPHIQNFLPGVFEKNGMDSVTSVSIARPAKNGTRVIKLADLASKVGL